MVRRALSCAFLAAAAAAGSAARADVTMSATPCHHVGDLFTIEIRKGSTPVAVVGAQLFLSYDNAVAEYIGGTGGDPPYTFELLDRTSGSTIDYAVGVPGGGPGLTADAVIARLVFKARTEVCSDASFLSVRAHNPPSRLTDSLGNEATVPFHGLSTPITIDDTMPTIGCQPNLNVLADPGVCTHTFAPFIPPVFNDNCAAALTAVRSDNPLLTPSDPFPVGLTSIVWTATDCVGNSASCLQTVTVSNTNALNVTVQLPNVNPAAFSRCISFDLYTAATCPGAPALSFDAVMTFTGGVATGSFTVPCNAYTCIQARDRLHSIRRTADASHFGVVGPAYVASFVDSSVGHQWYAPGNDALTCGNLNDDPYIDILDYGAFLGQVFANYGSPNTTCSTAFPHADLNGDGTVDFLDYTFISANFLAIRDADCCGVDLAASGPVLDISVFDLAARGDYQAARTADLNHDGRLNMDDIAWLGAHGLPLCPADFNGDQVVSVQDLFEYIGAWFNAYPAADANNDRRVSVDDLFFYLNAWLNGCP